MEIICTLLFIVLVIKDNYVRYSIASAESNVDFSSYFMCGNIVKILLASRARNSKKERTVWGILWRYLACQSKLQRSNPDWLRLPMQSLWGSDMLLDQWAIRRRRPDLVRGFSQWQRCRRWTERSVEKLSFGRGKPTTRGTSHVNGVAKRSRQRVLGMG